MREPTLASAQLVHDRAPRPAMLFNRTFDILAWNQEMANLVIDFAVLPVHQRNSMWLLLLEPSPRDFYCERERTIREGIADMRAARAAHPDDEVLAARIAEFTAASAEFRAAWARHDVRVQGRGRKSLRHRSVGNLTIDYEVLLPLQEPEQRVVIYRAADSAS